MDPITKKKKSMKNNQFQCYKCKGYFDEGPEEKALKELRENFSKECKPENCEVFCDDCYKDFMKTFKIH